MSLFTIGVLAGILCALVIGLIAYFVSGGSKAKPKYDERQIAAQNAAYKHGFFATLICLAISAFLLIADVLPSSLPYGAVALITASGLIGLLVFAVTSILKDAYLGYNQNPRKWYITFALIIILNFICAFFNDNGISWLNLACAVTLLIVLLTQLIHRWRNPLNDEEDPE